VRPTAGPVTAPPPAQRDPWLWLTGAAVLPLLLKSLGAPLGEPAAEDFDFLHHAVLLGRHSWLDGGGSLSFWRPLAQQGYYGAFGELMLAHPGVMAAIHALLLAVTAMMIYRSARHHASGPVAAALGVFPLVAESVRALISWPGHFADLGCLFFSALAIHQAMRQRRVASLASLAAALLCKEQAVVAALMIPLLPSSHTNEAAAAVRAERTRWAFATGALTLVWAAINLAMRRAAGLTLPHGLSVDADALGATLVPRLLWAAVNGTRAAFSLPAGSTTRALWVGIAVSLVLVIAFAFIAIDPRARARFRERSRWFLWGAGWFALSTVMLAPAAPLWAPNRAVFGSLGLGVALIVLLRAARPGLVAALLAVRLAALAASPGPPALVATGAPENGDFIDFERLIRIQRLMRETREVLEARLPSPDPGTRVGWIDMPRGAVYAFGGDRAIQAWYRDTTLRWVAPADLAADTSLAAIVQYQLEHAPAVAIVEPAALRASWQAEALLADSAWSEAMPVLAAAESLQRDASARVFRSGVLAQRARCLFGLGRRDEGAAEAERALELLPENSSARYLLASAALERNDLDETRRQLDTLVRYFPADSVARRLRDSLPTR